MVIQLFLNLFFFIVPNKTKKCSEGRSNRDVKVRIYEIEVCCPHTRVDTRPDGTIGAQSLFFHIWEEVEVDSFSEFSVSRGTLQNRPGSHFPSRGKNCFPLSENSVVPTR
jgi:hypothetical protein